MTSLTMTIGTALIAAAALSGCTGPQQSDTSERDAQIQRNIQSLRNSMKVSNELPRVDDPNAAPTGNAADPAPR